uniref:Tetratricopeptide TPR_2 n=1 Tax=uncultured organism TaxID=155900 RepID=M1PW11_9ZZZZ|nr:tetratricopeptide TPR_2 [uncultured organism]
MAFIGIGEKKKTEDKSIFDANKKQTFYDTTRFIKNLSKENPLLIFLDDLQWVDRATLDILIYMLGKLEGFPVLFIGTYRPEDVSSKHHLIDMKHRLTIENRIKTIDLNPLDLENTEDTVKSLLNDDNIQEQFIELIHKKTEGNPLFIKESIKQMVDEGIIDIEKNKYPKKEEDIVASELVNNVIERRLKRFDDETKKIMEIGSIIGGSIPYDLLLETSKMDEIELLDHVDLLIEEQFWEEDSKDELFYFSHNLIEKTVYNQIRDMKKKLIHKKIADNIKNIYSYKIEELYPNLARHYEGGKDYSNALDYYLKAGEKAEEVYANEDAIEMYEKALDLSERTKGKKIDRIDILENLSRAYSLLGKYKKSREYLNDAMEIDHIDKEKKAKLYSKIGNIWTKEGEYEKSLKEIKKGLELIDDDTKSKADLLSMKGWVSIRHSEYEQAKDIFKEEMQIAEKIDDRESISQAYHNLGTAYNFLKEFENSEKHLKKAKELRSSEKEIEDKAKTLNNLGVLYENINIDKTLEYYQKSLEKAEKIGNIHLSIGLLSNIGRVYYHKAEFDKAIENLNDSLEIRKRIGDKYGISLSYVNLGLVYTDKGKFDKAEEYHERSLAIVDQMGESYCKAINLRSLGKIYELKGDQEKSYDYYQKSLQCSKEGGNKAQTSLNYSYISEYYLKSGNIQKSKEMAEKSLTLSKEIKTIKENAIAYGILGRIYNRKGNVEKAIDYLEKAKKKLMKSGFDLDLAKIHLYLGKIYGIKDEEISNKYLNEAKSTFEKSKMKPWLKMINKNNN